MTFIFQREASMASSSVRNSCADWQDNARYVSITMEFRCNLRCVYCMIEGTMDRLVPQTPETFDALLSEQRRTGRWIGLVLTGSEITLRRDLPDLASRARDAGFEHVRIQTHGARLANAEYCSHLVAAGVDEFFVSVAGCDRESHDRITDVRGAWDKMMCGLANLDQYEHVRVITNTVVTRLSHPLLRQMVEALAPLRRVVQHEFWVYWPMAEEDEKGLCARHSDVLPDLVSAMVTARRLGRCVEVKNFPHCLLAKAGFGEALVNDQPMLLIDQQFWTEFERNGFHQCVHRSACGSEVCLGLNTAYVNRFGWEADVLQPL